MKLKWNKYLRNELRKKKTDASEKYYEKAVSQSNRVTKYRFYLENDAWCMQSKKCKM